MKIKKIKKLSGFTLLEMIVATAIFVIVSTMCIGIYILTIKANTRVIIMQKIQNEMRFAMDYISREIRLANIDYDYYTDFKITNPSEELALEDNFSNRVIFRKITRENEELGEEIGFLQVKYNNSDWVDITANNVNLKDLYFYISPTQYPATNDDFNKQPLVTIVMKFVDEGNQLETFLQSTISARNYTQ
ncbi:MAG: prepilin-type N-terminal cleavage/methylation domain-containing protein [Patescibacteria group bacterium]|nr:prepilin-type N-terminal cleavage/methylation domain-containing protein [Patescibacteria group bacterium]